MKHTFTLILILFLTVLCKSAYSDAWTNQRNSCNIFGDKFKAVTMVKNCDVPWFKCRKGITDCTFADSYCPYIEEIVPGWEVLHYAKASLGWRTIQVVPFEIRVCCTSETEVNTGIGFCGGENSFYKPSFYSNSPILVLPKKDNQKVIKLTVRETIWDNVNRRVILKGIEGEMMVNSDDIANDYVSFVLSVTNSPKPFSNNEEDNTKEYLNSVLWSAQAILNNGRLITNGNFKIEDFTFNKESKDNRYIRVNLKSDEMIVPIPEGYNMEALVMNNGSDAGNLGYGISEKFEIKNAIQSITIKEPLVIADKFEFLNYPNPVKDNVSIQIELREASSIKVLVYDSEGNIEQMVYEGYLKAGKTLRIEHSLKALKPRRVYFLKLLTKDKTLIRKILVE